MPPKRKRKRPVSPAESAAGASGSGQQDLGQKPAAKLQQLAAATPAGTTLDSLQAHILALKATRDALWEEYLKPRWRR
ncbi:hypothetical protein HaLaN_31219, partial [Haematococcus lacustris]